MIEVEQLTKSFRDRKKGIVHAVESVSFKCEPGLVYGLLGPNGAGKTTILRMISTAIRPTSGTGSVNGHDFVKEPEKVRACIGFISANMGLYARLTPREVLTFFARMHDIKPDIYKKRIAELSAVFDMDEFLDRPCDKLSLGMKQKVGISRCLVHSPPVMILDEPTAGLDWRAVIVSRAILDLSTHVMSEVQRLCDRVGIIHRGKLRFDGNLEELASQYGDDLEDAFVKVIEEDEAIA